MPFLDFKGKSVVYAHHLRVPFRSLKVDEKKSLPIPLSGLKASRQSKSGKQDKLNQDKLNQDKLNQDESNRAQNSSKALDDNLIIQGDNLHALKALLPRYSGKIKCIYIDPPYNTGNEGWKYNDKVNSPMMREWLKQNGIGTDDEERHDKWLCMMWPRLQLLKELLSDDGVIFVSIDDNECFRLMAIMEEIFGEENYSTYFIWEKKKKPSFLHKNIGVVTDFILCYLKNKEHSFPFSLEKTTEGKKYPLNRAGNKESILKFQKGSVQFSIEDQTIEPQDMSEGEIKTQLIDQVIIKNGTNFSEFSLKGEWGYSQKTLNKIISEGENISIRKIPFRPNHIRKGGEIKKMQNLLSQTRYQIPTNEDATKEMINIFGKPIFTNPKPSGLIKKLIQSVTYKDKNSIILDSFAGSGTTAHAVLALNKEDGGQRKFILVECEDYASDITAERVRRVIKGVPGAKDENLKKGLGGSFTYCSLGAEINAENMLKGKLPEYKQLAEYIFYTATGKNLEKLPRENPTWFIGETEFYRLHLAYKPDVSFLRSKKADLNLDLAEKIKKQNLTKKRTLVFAPAKYIDQKELKQDYGIEFCHLPYDIYKLIA